MILTRNSISTFITLYGKLIAFGRKKSNFNTVDEFCQLCSVVEVLLTGFIAYQLSRIHNSDLKVALISSGEEHEGHGI